jgi:hypothetical protein
MTPLGKTPLLSPRNVPLWMGVALSTVLATLMVWKP